MAAVERQHRQQVQQPEREADEAEHEEEVARALRARPARRRATIPTELDTWFVSRPVARWPSPRTVLGGDVPREPIASRAAAGSDSPAPVRDSIAMPIR